MKITLLFLTTILLSSQLVSAQKIDTPSPDSPKDRYAFYMKKHKANRTTGFLLLGGGLVMAVSGVASGVSGGVVTSGSSSAKYKGEGLFYAGCVTTLTSIPFFVFSAINKRKAKVTLKKESLSMDNISKSKYTAISLKLSL